MKSDWTLNSAKDALRKSKSTILALALGLAMGFAGGQAVHSMNNTPDKPAKESVKVPVHADAQRAESCPHRKGMGFTFSVDPWSGSFIRDSFFNDFDAFADMPASFARDLKLRTLPATPSIDASETAGEVRITADVPGMEDKDLDVSVSDSTVTIKGVKKREISEKDARKSERFYGSFERTLSLPCRVECEKADANLKNGVLTIVIPKSQIAHKDSKKLTIRTQ